MRSSTTSAPYSTSRQNVQILWVADVAESTLCGSCVWPLCVSAERLVACRMRGVAVVGRFDFLLWCVLRRAHHVPISYYRRCVSSCPSVLWAGRGDGGFVFVVCLGVRLGLLTPDRPSSFILFLTRSGIAITYLIPFVA